MYLGGIVEGYGQVCVPPTLAGDYFTWQGRERPTNQWTATVFQIGSNYLPGNDAMGNPYDPNRNFSGAFSQANREFKGYLRRGNNPSFLPNGTLNFDANFTDNSALGLDADEFFDTGVSPTAAGGCPVELQHFGVIARSRFTVPAAGEGIYRITIGSDDGSHFRMFEPGTAGTINDLIPDVNGNPMVHDNWFKSASDVPPNFVYNDNIRNYYVPLTAGQTIWMNLNFWERQGFSRLSFNMQLYVGPGEVQIPGFPLGSASYCGPNIDIPQLTSQGPAVFADNSITPTYQWQYALVDDPNPANWTDIAGATDIHYKIPAFEDLTNEEYKDDFEGTLYFRRLAIDNENNRFPTNVLEITNTIIARLDEGEYGNNEWIGHIYKQTGAFDFNTVLSPENYIGRHYEGQNFEQNFGLGPQFVPDHGCAFSINEFGVRYRMRYEAQAGEYTVQVRGDDGFRLSIDGGATWLIDDYRLRFGGAVTLPATFTVQEDTELFMVLEYFENTGDEIIKFDFVGTPLPVEWGRVFGNACGDSNCLTWETIQEKNTSHFTVERSYDGSEWTPIGERVEAQGFSTEATSYQVSDASFMRERSFYRVKQVDLDGSMDYSETIRIDNHSFKNKMLPYPNPTVDRVRFYSPEEVMMVQVTSHDARVNTQADFELIDENIYELDFSQMQSSHYVITVVTKGSKASHKIIKK